MGERGNHACGAIGLTYSENREVSQIREQTMKPIEISPERLALLHELNERGKKKWRERRKNAQSNANETDSSPSLETTTKTEPSSKED